MGLSFHYSGSFNKHASLDRMIEEVKDIAETFKWKYNIYKDRFPKNSFGKTTFNQNIYGISFTPENCETVWLCFLSNGKMSSPMHLQFYGKSENKAEQQYLYMLSVKTQYAGIEIHKLIIQLFKYLSEKYLESFTLSDEGKYWETGDEKLLEETFKLYTDLLNNFVSAIESYPKKAGETFENYFERLMKQIHAKNKE
ncbi:MAG: hypothetical protein JWQ09_1408 [Segetibacter sp.]|nr:hypothetical protein [Segetibacter sp.]